MRVGFIFRIKPELKNEYKKAHAEVWPEQVKALKDSGFKNYSIFLSNNDTVFNYMETDDFEKSISKLFEMESNTRWQKVMEKFFIKEDHSKIGPDIVTLEEIYHLD